MERGICPIAPLVLLLALYSLTGSRVWHLGSLDVISHVTIGTTHGPFLLVVCWRQVTISHGCQDIEPQTFRGLRAGRHGVHTTVRRGKPKLKYLPGWVDRRRHQANPVNTTVDHWNWLPWTMAVHCHNTVPLSSFLIWRTSCFFIRRLPIHVEKSFD